MQNIWLTLHMNLSAESEDGPGWYIASARDGGVPLIEPVRVSPQIATELAESFEMALPDSALPPTQIVQSGNTLVQEAIKTQLAEAEAQAVRIAKLRRLLADETPATLEPQPQQENENDL